MHILQILKAQVPVMTEATFVDVNIWIRINDAMNLALGLWVVLCQKYYDLKQVGEKPNYIHNLE